MAGPAPDHDSKMTTLVERMAACPHFGQRLREHPLGLIAPEWVDDPDFDLARHIHRVALPRPGDDDILFRAVADVMAMRLHRDFPLWEVWVIEGLADNRWAVLVKVHHCMADGIAATHMFTGLCDDGVDEGFAQRIRASKLARPTRKESGLGLDPVKVLTGLTGIASGGIRAARNAVGLTNALTHPAPSSTLLGPVGSRRRFGGARVPMSDLAQVCEKFGVTVGDVALTAVTESYREMLVRRGESLHPESLPVLVPVSTDAGHASGRLVSVMRPHLPVEEENLVARLRMVHSRLQRAKTAGQQHTGNAVLSMANRLPFALTSRVVRLLTRLPQHGVVTVATNVHGPRQPLHIMGRKVLSLFPVPPIGMNIRTGIAMLSYADDFYFGILADHETVPDIDALAGGIEHAVARLVGPVAGGASRPNAAV